MAKKKSGKFSKQDLVFELMIRQPAFVDEAYANMVIRNVREEKDPPLLDKVEFKSIEDGLSVQMLHLGSYDDEPATFSVMENFAEQHGYRRSEKTHREIYISDPSRTPVEKLKTTLRFKVEQA